MSAATLRELLGGDALIVTPAVHDGLSARLVELIGFDCAYISGAAICASLGLPDVGILTLTELTERCRYVRAATTARLICDIDGGFGNYANVRRTVVELGGMGIDGVKLDDVPPGATVDEAPVQATVDKISAAVDHRPSPDLVVAVRVVARPGDSVAAVAGRCGAYVAAGADLVQPFPMLRGGALPGPEETAVVATIGVPTVATLESSWDRSLAEVQAAGFRLALFPEAITAAARSAMGAVLDALATTGSIDSVGDRFVETKFLTDLLGVPAARALEDRYELARESTWTPW